MKSYFKMEENMNVSRILGHNYVTVKHLQQNKYLVTYNDQEYKIKGCPGDVILVNTASVDKVIYRKAPSNPIKRILYTRCGLTGRIYMNLEKIKERFNECEHSTDISGLHTAYALKQITDADNIPLAAILYSERSRVIDGQRVILTYNVEGIFFDYTKATEEHAIEIANDITRKKNQAYKNRTRITGRVCNADEFKEINKLMD